MPELLDEAQRLEDGFDLLEEDDDPQYAEPEDRPLFWY